LCREERSSKAPEAVLGKLLLNKYDFGANQFSEM